MTISLCFYHLITIIIIIIQNYLGVPHFRFFSTLNVPRHQLTSPVIYSPTPPQLSSSTSPTLRRHNYRDHHLASQLRPPRLPSPKRRHLLASYKVAPGPPGRRRERVRPPGLPVHRRPSAPLPCASPRGSHRVLPHRGHYCLSSH
jgi:hypothetical protein